jgi:predicted transposase YdaD
MSETDNPLKMLISEFAQDFAAWLLNTPVQAVRPLNAEFPARPLRGDLLFEVLNRQGEKHLLHVELQGRRSHQPMPFRELEYMSQTAIREIPLPLGSGAPRLHSVVFYVGEGAGREDDGRYTIHGLVDEVSLHWQYQVIRLWEISADSLLQLEQPALAALVGLTRLQQPQEELPRALRAIRSVPDAIERQRLLTALVTLLPTEEVTQMIEKLLEESETLLLDTPYLRRIRELGREEGLQTGVQIGREEGMQIGREEGVQTGVQIGREEGMQIGREEGVQTGVQIGREEGLRQAILEGVVRKFDPPTTDYRQLMQHLEQIHQPDALQQILLALLDAPEMATMLRLAEETAVNA